MIHKGHQGITKCRRHAMSPVWWPGRSQQIEDLVSQCKVCILSRKNHPEPLQPIPLPECKWQKVGTDLMELKQQTYLIVVDYYSCYIEMAKSNSTTSRSIINHLKSIFSGHDIPETVVSDNRPQYSCEEFSLVTTSYGFTHVTSSPKHTSDNGEAERAVETVKNLLRGSEDPYNVLLNYRATPLANGLSPAEILMSQILETKLSMKPTTLVSKVPDDSEIRNKEESAKIKMKLNFDSHHRAQPLIPIETGQTVSVADRKEPVKYLVRSIQGHMSSKLPVAFTA